MTPPRNSVPLGRCVATDQPTEVREPRDVIVEAMAAAGQRLAVQWGHEPWSDSWANLVAGTLVDALIAVDSRWIREADVTGDSGHGVTTYRCGAGPAEDNDA